MQTAALNNIARLRAEGKNKFCYWYRKNLFICKKSDDEGSEFYFMGEVTVKPEHCIGTTINGKNGEKLSIVQVFYDMKQPVEPKIYNYFEGK